MLNEKMIEHKIAHIHMHIHQLKHHDTWPWIILDICSPQVIAMKQLGEMLAQGQWIQDILNLAQAHWILNVVW